MALDKAKIRHSFASASATYDAAADLQRTVADELLTHLSTNVSGVILDIGCGTGYLTQQLLRFQPNQLIALDIALPMLQATHERVQTATLLCADAEALPLAQDSIDHVFSNLALQWCTDLSAVFNGVKQALKPNGQFIFSTFAPHTLKELKTAWASIDDYSHVNDFYDAKQLEQFLQQAGFFNIQITQILYTRYYDSVLALMHELKQIGAHNVIKERNKYITSKISMQQMIAAYERQYSINNKILASFEVFMVVASA